MMHHSTLFALLALLPQPSQDGQLHADLTRLLSEPPSGSFSCESVGLDSPLNEGDFVESLEYARENYLGCFLATGPDEARKLERMRKDVHDKGADFVPSPLSRVSSELRKTWVSHQILIDWPYWRASAQQPSHTGEGMIATVSTFDTNGRWEAQYSETGVLVSAARWKTRSAYQQSTGALMLFLRLVLQAELILEFAELDRGLHVRDGELKARANFQEMSRHPALRVDLRSPGAFRSYPGWATIVFKTVGGGYELRMDWFDCLGGRLQADTMAWASPDRFPDLTMISYAPGIEMPYDETRVVVHDKSDEGPVLEPEFRWKPSEDTLVNDQRFVVPVAYEVEPYGLPPEDADLIARVDALLLDTGGQGLVDASAQSSGYRPVSPVATTPAITQESESPVPSSSREWLLAAGLVTSLLLSVAVVLKK